LGVDLSLWDLATGEAQGRVAHDQMAENGSGVLAISADGRTLLTRDLPGRKETPVEERLRVWDWAPLWRSIPGSNWLPIFGFLSLFVAGVLGCEAVRQLLLARQQLLARRGQGGSWQARRSEHGQ
jgi:hypothetical protein